jgi:hypothetical protein
MPVKISGSEAVVVDSTIFFFGGYSDSLQIVVDWIYSYKPAQNSWNFIGRMKKRRSNFVADRIGNKIYITGGELNNPLRASGILEEFDCSTLTSAVIDSNMEFNRIHSSGLIKDSTLCLIGGMPFGPTDPTTPYIIEYNIPLRKIVYNYIPNFPGMRSEQMISFLFNKIYIFGGLYNTVSGDIYSYGISDQHLNVEHLSLLRPRANGRAIKLKDSNQVFIIGGYNEIELAMNSVDLYEFTDSMHIVSRPYQPMNFKRNDFMAVNYYGSIYAFGGDDDFGNPVDKVERLQFLTAVDETGKPAPTGFKLDQNYPNPFNLGTIISFYVPETSMISIKVYDVMGRQVANLINEEKQSGNYKIPFNGIGLASGIYYYRINGTKSGGTSGNNFTETKKMILLK